MMTTKQHDELWMAAFSKIPEVSDSLRRANAIAIFKELYAIGELDKDAYVESLMRIAVMEGFKPNY